MKKFLKVIFIIVAIIGLIFLYGYYKKVKRDLVDYNISEKLVVKFEEDDNKYLVNLNDGSYIKYDGEYNDYFPINYTDEEKFYNKRIYNKNNKIIYIYLYPGFNQGYWSQNGNYLITREGYIARMFGLFISKRTGFQNINIINPETGKNKQLDIIDEKGKYLEVETILGYVE